MAQITTTELATELGTDSRTVRKFLRADARSRGEAIPGKGARWSIERREVRSLKKRFDAWSAAQDEAREARAKVEHSVAPDNGEVTESETEESLDSLDSLEGPSDAELAELEA